MHHDLFGPWTPRKCGLWLVLTVLVCLIQGHSFWYSLAPPRTRILDFYQEWASARNFWNGLPIYAPQSETAKLYLGASWKMDGPFDLKYNAHPPTSVLLVLPLGKLDYPDAFLAWNLISFAALGLSLWLIVRQLDLVFTPWALLPTVSFLLMWGPFRQQVNQAQLNLVLLLLFTLIWTADRSDRPGWAGICLGLATAIKLFPGFLFLYFMMRRQWKTVAAGVASGAAVTALTAAVLGVESYRAYLQDALPHVSNFRYGWLNASFLGYWSRLFDGGVSLVVPLARSPMMTRGLWVGCSVIVVAILWRVVSRARSQGEQDLAYGQALITMLLVSPITWDHYFLFLLLPLVFFWVRWPRLGWERGSFILLVLVLFVNPRFLWDRTVPSLPEIAGGVAWPIHNLGVIAYLFYTLLAFFVLGLAVFRRETTPHARNTAAPEPLEAPLSV